jgi:demethylmenaquinone methyltransferase/2-methoxy-6-polyprenyl-1,4-benzoquinol methylase
VQSSEFLKHNTELFSKVAPYYDGLDLVIGPVRRRFVEFVSPPPNAKVLDVATGTGKQALAFAAAGHQVIGVDLSRDMLSVAVRNNRYANARFAIGDACRLPFEDETFDLTSMSFALHCMPAVLRVRAVRELRRVTRRHGRISFVDYGMPANRLGREIEYRFVSLYETDHWREFIRSDFDGLLTDEGLRVERQGRFFLGCMRMLYCSRLGS